MATKLPTPLPAFPKPPSPSPPPRRAATEPGAPAGAAGDPPSVDARLRVARAAIAAARAGDATPLARLRARKLSLPVRRGRPQAPLLMFLRVLLSGRYPRTVPAIAAEAGVSRPAGYRYIAEIERLSVIPLRRSADPMSARGQLVGVDWAAMKDRGA